MTIALRFNNPSEGARSLVTRAGKADLAIKRYEAWAKTSAGKAILATEEGKAKYFALGQSLQEIAGQLRLPEAA